MIAPKDMYGRQGGRVGHNEGADLDELRSVVGDPCPGCGAPSGYWKVAARVFDLDAQMGDVVYTCQSCHSDAHEVAAEGRRTGTDWAGALAP